MQHHCTCQEGPQVGPRVTEIDKHNWANVSRQLSRVSGNQADRYHLMCRLPTKTFYDANAIPASSASSTGSTLPAAAMLESLGVRLWHADHSDHHHDDKASGSMADRLMQFHHEVRCCSLLRVMLSSLDLHLEGGCQCAPSALKHNSISLERDVWLQHARLLISQPCTSDRRHLHTHTNNFWLAQHTFAIPSPVAPVGHSRTHLQAACAGKFSHSFARAGDRHRHRKRKRIAAEPHAGARARADMRGGALRGRCAWAGPIYRGHGRARRVA